MQETVNCVDGKQCKGEQGILLRFDFKVFHTTAMGKRLADATTGSQESVDKDRKDPDKFVYSRTTCSHALCRVSTLVSSKEAYSKARDLLLVFRGCYTRPDQP